MYPCHNAQKTQLSFNLNLTLTSHTLSALQSSKLCFASCLKLCSTIAGQASNFLATTTGSSSLLGSGRAANVAMELFWQRLAGGNET